MLVGSYRHITTAPTSLLKGSCRVPCLCPHGKYYSLALRVCFLHSPPTHPYSDRLEGPPSQGLQWTGSLVGPLLLQLLAICRYLDKGWGVRWSRRFGRTGAELQC